MALYKDAHIKINAREITVKGFLIPRLTALTIRPDEIISIKEVKLNWRDRLTVQGINDFKVWWLFDIFRFRADQAFIISLHSLPMKLGITVSKPKRVAQLLKENFSSKFTPY